MSSNRGIVYSLDATSALLLLLGVGLTILLFAYTLAPTQASQENFNLKAADTVDLLSRLTVSDVRRAPPVAALFDDQVVGDVVLNYSVAQLVADLWATNDTLNLTRAVNVSDYLLSGLFFSQEHFVLRAAGFPFADRAPPNESAVGAARVLVSGISSDRAFAKGCVSRVLVQKIRGREENDLSYFGGYEGQGNLTVVVQGVPSGANITEAYLEANLGGNATVYLNGVFCGIVNTSRTRYNVTRYVWNQTTAPACLGAALSGAENVFELNFTPFNLSTAYVGGGFFRITYQTPELVPVTDGSQRHYFNGVDGIINYFSSFFVPGNVTRVTGQLHLRNNFTTYLIVGNQTVYEDNGTAEDRVIVLDESNFTSVFPGYAGLSDTTVPLRLGVKANLTGGSGIADVVLITDVSGSMNWRLNQDSVNGVIRTCTDANLYSNDTQRLALAKCVDKDFIDIILSQSGNRLALVSFSTTTSSANWSTNATAQKAVVDTYAQGGGTCLACAINRAYQLLDDVYNATRKKYVIVMSDGVANYRTTGMCQLTGVDGDGATEWMAGDSGGYVGLNLTDFSRYDRYYAGTNAAYALSYASGAVRAVGPSSKFFAYNGTAWGETHDLGGDTPNALHLFNDTFGLAAGTSGKVYRLLGSTWSEFSDRGSQTWNGIAAYNSSWWVVSGYQSSTGYVQHYDGTTWRASNTTAAVLYDLELVNATWALVGGSAGKVYAWNGTNLTELTDTGSHVWSTVSVVNDTYAVLGATDGSLRLWTGSGFSVFSSPTTRAINDLIFRSGTDGTLVTDNALAYHWNGSSWTLAYDGRSNGIDTTGTYCSDPDVCSTLFSNNFAAQNANYSSCRLWNDFPNSTVYSVGFGPVGSCSIGNATLYNVALCGNGSYFASTNANELADFYRNLAAAIVKESNASQSVQIVGDVRTRLYPDSYLDITFTPAVVPPYGSVAVSKSVPLASCQGSVQIPPSLTPFDTSVTSYSADRWSANVSVHDGTGWSTAFRLRDYNATSYKEVGDPYWVQVRPSRFRAGATNTLDVRTEYAPGNATSECSTDNTFFYRGWLNGSVPYGARFDRCYARNVTVYYDRDGDNQADGYAHVALGNPSEPAIEADDLNALGDNAVEDAFLRLLGLLDLNTSGGVPGSSQNPIDLPLDGIATNVLQTGDLPLMNLTDLAVVVWK